MNPYNVWIVFTNYNDGERLARVAFAHEDEARAYAVAQEPLRGRKHSVMKVQFCGRGFEAAS